MTKQQIKDLVVAKIAGQGTAVDAASVLPTIINAMLDLIPESVPQPPLVYDGNFSIGDLIFSTDTEESAEEEIVAAVKAGRTVVIKDNNGAEIRLGVVTGLDAYNQPIMVVGDDNGDSHALHYTWSA